MITEDQWIELYDLHNPVVHATRELIQRGGDTESALVECVKMLAKSNAELIQIAINATSTFNAPTISPAMLARGKL